MTIGRRVTVLGGEQLTGELLVRALRSNGLFEVDWAASHPEVPLDDGAVVVVVDPAVALLRCVTHSGARAVAVVTAGEPSADDEARLLLGGADAVVSVEADTENVLQRIEVVSHGDAHIAPDRLRAVLEQLRRHGPRGTTRADLTMRERQILLSIDRGESVKQTARSLGISPKTVENLQSKLFTKLDARNRAQAVSQAHDLGLLGDAGALGENADDPLHPNGRG